MPCENAVVRGTSTLISVCKRSSSPPHIQVFSALEDLCDLMSKNVGHRSYIFEASNSNAKKIYNFMVGALQGHVHWTLCSLLCCC